MTETIFNIIQSISIIIASFVAIVGINSWRKEAKWKRKFELAEEVLSSFYDVKEKIVSIRSPFSGNLEGSSRKQKENETKEEKENFDRAYIPFERYNKENEAFIRLYTLKFRFMAVFGKEHSKPFDEIKKIINDILFAAHYLGTHYWQQQGKKFSTEDAFEKHLSKMHEYESVIWAGFLDKEDIIDKRVNEAINEIEIVCSNIKS